MLRQRLRHASDLEIIVEVDRALLIAMRRPVVPSAHKGMLENGELVRIVTDIVEQPDDKPWRDRSPTDPHRFHDRGAALLSRHPRDEIEAVRHCLWQVAIARAVADEIGAHGKYDVNRNIALAARFKQQLYERRGVLVTTGLIGRVGKTEKLLELIDDDEDLIAFRQAGETNHLDEAEAAASERHFEQHGGFSGRIHPRGRLAAARGAGG